jgi:hypothetical protein
MRVQGAVVHERYFRVEVRTIDDLRRAIGPTASRAEAEALWVMLSEARMLVPAGRSHITGLLTPAEWHRWCDRAWRTARSRQNRRATAASFDRSMPAAS